MLNRRIIPCLDIANGRTVKGINFIGLKDVGDAVELAQRYEQEGADEMVFLAINARNESKTERLNLIDKIAQNLSIPFTIGGGINTLEEAKEVLDCGADKVSLNTAAVLCPELITEISSVYGNQCVVVAVDAIWIKDDWRVAINGGKTLLDLRVIDWVKKVEALGAGEILLTSIDADGMKTGFNIELTNVVCNAVQLPIIGSGGAGKVSDFANLFSLTEATGGLAASIFHDKTLPIPKLKQELEELGAKIRRL